MRGHFIWSHAQIIPEDLSGRSTTGEANALLAPSKLGGKRFSGEQSVDAAADGEKVRSPGSAGAYCSGISSRKPETQHTGVGTPREALMLNAQDQHVSDSGTLPISRLGVPGGSAKAN